MIPLMSPKRNPKFKCELFLLIPTLSFEGRDTRVVPENVHKTPFFGETYHLTWVNWIKHKKNQMTCTERKRQTGTHFLVRLTTLLG